MCETIPLPPLRIDELDAYDDPYPERPNRAIPVWITIGMAALTFVAALYFGVLLVIFFDAVSLAAFAFLSFAWRA